MDKVGAKGAVEKAAGSVKEAAGKATGNKKLAAEGAADKVSGSAEQELGRSPMRRRRRPRRPDKAPAELRLGRCFNTRPRRLEAAFEGRFPDSRQRRLMARTRRRVSAPG